MQTQHTHAAGAQQVRSYILRITSKQLSAWVFQPRLGVTELKPGEVPWEGTEIAVRRPVL